MPGSTAPPGQQCGHRGVGPLAGAGPVLDPAVKPGTRVVPGGAVTDGDHTGQAGAAVGAALDAVVELEARARQPFDARAGADTDDHDVGGDAAAVLEQDGRRPGSPRSVP